MNGNVDAKADGVFDASNSPSKRRVDDGAEALPAVAHGENDGDDPQPKRVKIDAENGAEPSEVSPVVSKRQRIPGVAMIKEEFLIKDAAGNVADSRGDAGEADDDAAEGRDAGNEGRGGGGRGGRKAKKRGGQNKDRDFGRSRDAVRLCASVAHSPEFSPKTCRLGERCHALHDLRAYLRDGRRGDLATFDGVCPVFAVYGRCPSGWKCRFVSSHMQEMARDDGRTELVLVEKVKAASNGEGEPAEAAYAEDDDARPGVVNVVPAVEKQNLTRKRADLSRSEQYIRWLDQEVHLVKKIYNNHKKPDADVQEEEKKKMEGLAESTEATEVPKEGASNGNETRATKEDEKGQQPPLPPPPPPPSQPPAEPEADPPTAEDYRAQYIDPPFLPSEKRRLYFGPETPTLAPLTTQGNLPFRRLCVELGCQLTYSEMALGVDLLTGKQPEWALMKAHETETTPPRFSPPASSVVTDYDNSRDLKFGAQIAANQPWQAIKATEAMARLVPHLRLVDINCGCPIDLVYKSGGGAGLLESPNKLERMVRGMNAVSGEVPVTAKLRIGVRDNSPRYKKPADWGYIAECAALVRSYNAARDALTDTVRAPDPRTQAANAKGSTEDRLYFLGNGDCFSHVQYAQQLAEGGVDAVMIGRGALIKPWIFEEIAAGQYLDKTATERLGYVEKFARYGLEAWGTDEQGLGTTRRFLLEYLSFASRYVPVGLLEYLPPSLNDRPPAFRGRNELETLLASRNYKDWIKISEMFLGPAHPDFKFVPKHKSSSYEMEAEG
ncbi:tRNA dihydrouridine synthase [Niveomyces insectorum RCEF 264]|uniref:tRNA-dihydrouridine(47) synthase [NAD(P)(+)] n=1 Tax=Niveomyces insectorum RCEF 264 TaxID=1081102 RepID=A0A167N019_9HYPO|nr:tRNA dihydrouridine synthase [Niveomyces insectorum RCEF 264]